MSYRLALLDKTNGQCFSAILHSILTIHSLEHLETLEQELDDDYASKHNGRSRPVLESEDEDEESNMIFASAVRSFICHWLLLM